MDRNRLRRAISVHDAVPLAMDPQRATAAQHDPDRLLVFQPGGRGDPLCLRGPPAGPGLYRRTDAWIDGLPAQSVADPPRKTRRSTRHVDLRASANSRRVT